MLIYTHRQTPTRTLIPTVPARAFLDNPSFYRVNRGIAKRSHTSAAQGCIVHWLPNAKAPECLKEDGMHSLSLSVLANAGADGEALLHSLSDCVKVFDQRSSSMGESTKRRHTNAFREINDTFLAAMQLATSQRAGDGTNLVTAAVTTEFITEVFLHLRIPAHAVPVFNTHLVGDNPMRTCSLTPGFGNKQLSYDVVVSGLLEYHAGRLPGIIKNGSPSWPRAGFVREHQNKKRLYGLRSS